MYKFYSHFSTDFEPLVKLISQLVETFFVPCLTMKNVDPHSQVVEKVLQLMLCVIGGLSSSKNMPALRQVSLQWESVFDITSERYLIVQLFCYLLSFLCGPHTYALLQSTDFH